MMPAPAMWRVILTGNVPGKLSDVTAVIKRFEATATIGKKLSLPKPAAGLSLVKGRETISWYVSLQVSDGKSESRYMAQAINRPMRIGTYPRMTVGEAMAVRNSYCREYQAILSARKTTPQQQSQPSQTPPPYPKPVPVEPAPVTEDLKAVPDDFWKVMDALNPFLRRLPPADGLKFVKLICEAMQ